MYSMNSALQREINRQRALDYCMYMMLSSYFKGSICKSTFLEKRLYLYYKEQKPDTQVELEEKCIQLIEQEILPQIPKACWKERVQIKLTQRGLREGVMLFVYGKGFWMQVAIKDIPGRKHSPKLSLHYHLGEGNIFAG